jgi:hypothetical protein
MKKYNVTIYTTSDDLTITCQMDEHLLRDLRDFKWSEFFQMGDDYKEHILLELNGRR